MAKYTIYSTYGLVADSGFTQSAHCNYINKIVVDVEDPQLIELNLTFENEDDFKFMNDGVTITSGFTTNRIIGIVQYVANDDFENESLIKPNSENWRLYDLTSQTINYVSGMTLTSQDIVNTVYKIQFFTYGLQPYYDISYLNYPSNEVIDDDKLCFGDEVYFLGNVISDIRAIAHTTDIIIQLNLHEFNTTTNLSWNNQSSVIISEVGIYDENKNLVAIGKLNNPITKSNLTSRTIEFAIDF